MGLTFSNLVRTKENNKWIIRGTLAFDSSYPTGGESITNDDMGLAYMDSVIVEPSAGYSFNGIVASGGLSAKVLAYQTGSVTPAGTNGTSSVTAQTFTGTAPSTAENFATPVFSGTGQSSAGQVITTTDNQTMTLNQCTGMWFISATHGPYMIASNTAVSGAPAVLTTYGTAPTTDAGTYKILKGVTPAGTNGTSTAAAQIFTGAATTAAAASEVPNTTNLSAVTGVTFQISGN